MTPELQGVYPILATPFQEDGSLDLTGQVRLLHHLLEQGAHGLGLFGNASEGYALLSEERTELLKLIAKETGDRVPLIVSTGHTGTDAAVRLSKAAQDMGAAGLMVLPPYYLKPDADGLLYYFEAIAKAVSIPIMIQDAPLMSGVNMPAALLAKIANEIEGVWYAKVEAPPTAPKVTAVVRACGDRMTVFGGLNGQFFLEELKRGARGTMPNSDICDQFVAMWNAMESADEELAWEIFTRALPLIRFELQPGLGVSALKHNFVARGILKSAKVRHPTKECSPESLEELGILRERLEGK